MRVHLAILGGALLLLAFSDLSPATALAEEKPAARGETAAPRTKAKVASAEPESRGKIAGHLEREALRREIAKFGLVAIVEAAFRDPKSPPRPWAPDHARTRAQVSAGEGMWTATIDDAFGPGGLQLTSTADDRGPPAVIPAGEIATVGHGEALVDVTSFDAGHGHLSGTHTALAPRPRATSLARASIPPETIQRVVRGSFGRFRVCYESALRVNPALEGRIAVKFAIDPSGAVSVASDGGSDLPDSAVVACVVRGFASLTFPEFASGVVTVVYPLVFTPGS